MSIASVRVCHSNNSSLRRIAYKVLFTKRNMLTQLHCVRSSWHIFQTVCILLIPRSFYFVLCLFAFIRVFSLFFFFAIWKCAVCDRRDRTMERWTNDALTDFVLKIEEKKSGASVCEYRAQHYFFFQWMETSEESMQQSYFEPSDFDREKGTKHTFNYLRMKKEIKEHTYIVHLPVAMLLRKIPYGAKHNIKCPIRWCTTEMRTEVYASLKRRNWPNTVEKCRRKFTNFCHKRWKSGLRETKCKSFNSFSAFLSHSHSQSLTHVHTDNGSWCGWIWSDLERSKDVRD